MVAQDLIAQGLFRNLNTLSFDYRNAKSLIAVYCHSGVSCTGTFLAAFFLLNEIDQQLKNAKTAKDLKISVEETVSRLSLFRPHAVGKPKQYVTLDRLIDLYVGAKLKG
jgi:protein tyrosine phosphatase